MIRDITIGQFYPSKSIIHKLDPRTKLVATFIYIVCLFLINKYIGFILPTVFFVVVLIMSKVPFKYVIKGLRPIMFIIILTMTYQIFFGAGEALFTFGIIRITEAGIKRGVFLAVRLILLMLGTSMMTFTTTPNELTDGIERLFRGLNKIKVPVHEIAMMMSIALRFIPILLEETDKIMKAQQARGADFETGNIIHRAKAMVPIFIPLIISAFRRAFDLAYAMEARCYHGGDGRTRMNPLVYSIRDYVAYSILLIFIVINIFIMLF